MKKLPKSKVEFKVTIAWQDWEKYLDVAASEAAQEIKIEGFRPGKAPRKIVEQKVGKELIMNNATEKAVKKSYVNYIVTKKIEALGTPEIGLLKAQEGKDLEYKAIVSVMPEIKIEKGYEKEIKEINKDSANEVVVIDDKEVELEVEKLAASRVKLVTVNREAKKNDSVEIDFKVLMGGVPIENGSSKKHALVLGKGVFIPGFEEKIIGMKANEEKEFELTFPQKYHQKDLAGKPATFQVKVNLVQERQIPPVNDELAQSLGNFKDLVALKKSIKEGMEKEREKKNKETRRTQYLEAIIKKTTGELPTILIEEEVKKMMSEFEYQLQSTGMNIDQYLAQLKKKKEDLSKDWEPQAKKRVLSALVLEEIAKEQKIEASSKEVEAEMNKTMQYYKKVKEAEKNIDMKRLYNYSKVVLENEKVFTYLEKL